MKTKKDKPIHLYQTSKASLKNVAIIWQLNHHSGLAFLGVDQDK